MYVYVQRYFYPDNQYINDCLVTKIRKKMFYVIKTFCILFMASVTRKSKAYSLERNLLITILNSLGINYLIFSRAEENVSLKRK